MLRVAAYLVAISHLAIGVVGVAVIRPGTAAAADLPARMAYVAAEQTPWLLAWLVPPVAALLLLWMSAELRARLDPDGRNPRLRLALVAVGAGVAIEGSACCLAAAALPVLGGAGGSAAADTFLAVERVVQLGTTAFGNPPFSLAQLLFTRALAVAGAPRPVVWLGWATTLSGGAFMLAGAGTHFGLLAAANGALLLSLAAFSVALAQCRLARST